MREKLIKDFQGSCLHDIELLEEAIEECDSRMRLIASHRHLQLDDRLAHDGVQVPRRSTASGPWRTPDEPDAEAASTAAELVRYANRSPRPGQRRLLRSGLHCGAAEPPPPVRARCARRLPGPDRAPAGASAALRRRGRFPAGAARPVPAGRRSSRALLSLDDTGARLRAGRPPGARRPEGAPAQAPGVQGRLSRGTGNGARGHPGLRGPRERASASSDSSRRYRTSIPATW